MLKATGAAGMSVRVLVSLYNQAAAIGHHSRAEGAVSFMVVDYAQRLHTCSMVFHGVDYAAYVLSCCRGVTVRMLCAGAGPATQPTRISVQDGHCSTLVYDTGEC